MGCELSTAPSSSCPLRLLHSFISFTHLSTLLPASYALLSATADRQLFWNQIVTHSFRDDGGVYSPPRGSDRSHTPGTPISRLALSRAIGEPRLRPGRDVQTCRRSDVFQAIPFPIKFLRTLLHVLAFAKNSTPFFSVDSALFAKKHRDYIHQAKSFFLFLARFPFSSFPPSFITSLLRSGFHFTKLYFHHSRTYL